MKLPKILKQLFKYIRYHKGKYAQVNRECQKEIENVENNQIHEPQFFLDFYYEGQWESKAKIKISSY